LLEQSSRSASFVLISFHLDAALRLFARVWSPRRFRPRKFGKPISGSRKENCRGACSTRFAGQGSNKGDTFME
jgi:hypothetical protein